MPGPFHSLSISGSGMDVYQTWLDAISDNVANISNITSTDEPAFQERFVIAQADEGRSFGNRRFDIAGVGERSVGARGRADRTNGRMNGARVARIEYGNPYGHTIYEPDHHLADEDGFVRVPDVNLAHQMTHLLVAQRAYQANVTAFRTARDAYQRALEIGR